MSKNAASVGTIEQRVRIAMVGANLLMLAAIGCAGLGLWRMGTDLSWAGDFVIQNGLLSHWQIWIGAAAGCLYASMRLDWCARSDSNTRPSGS